MGTDVLRFMKTLFCHEHISCTNLSRFYGSKTGPLKSQNPTLEPISPLRPESGGLLDEPFQAFEKKKVLLTIKILIESSMCLLSYRKNCKWMILYEQKNNILNKPSIPRDFTSMLYMQEYRIVLLSREDVFFRSCWLEKVVSWTLILTIYHFLLSPWHHQGLKEGGMSNHVECPTKPITIKLGRTYLNRATSKIYL